MQFKQLFNDEDAVSPVIGVILMVAITVILAAVIGTFVLGLGDQVSNTSPQASFSFDFEEESSNSIADGTELANDADDTNDGTLSITHDGGDGIEATQLSVSDGSGTVVNTDAAPTFDSWANTVSAGSTEDIPVDDGDTIRVTWQSSNGGDTATLGKWTGPSA